MFKLFKKTREEAQPINESGAETQNEVSGGRFDPEGLYPPEETEVSEETGIMEEAEVAEAGGAVEVSSETRESGVADIQTLRRQFEEWLQGAVPEASIRESSCSAIAIVESFLQGEISPEPFFELIVKGADYERSVRDAEDAGEIRGRNTRIEEEEADAFASDGVPHPCSGGLPFRNDLPGIFGLARGARL